MRSLALLSTVLLSSYTLAQDYTDEPDPYYGQSPPVYPTREYHIADWTETYWHQLAEGNGGVDPDWQAAYARARELVSQMTLEEKVNMTRGHTGTCVGNTFNISSLGIPPLW